MDSATHPGGGSLSARLCIGRGAFTLDAELFARSGETLALIGPNGAGKSTILAALAGLAPLDAGYVRLGDRVLDDTAARIRVPIARRGIGIVFQDLRLFPALDVRDNIAYGLRARGISRSAGRATAERMLADLEIAHLARAKPPSLSGGEAQRVALARALVIEPALLLLDEPLAAIDARARADLRALLRRTLPAFGGPRLLVTHDPVEALVLADRLAVIEDGRIVQHGPPEEVRARPRSAFVAALVGLNLLRGRLRHAPEGVAMVVGEEGSLTVIDPGLPAGSEVAAILPPSAVTLHRDQPRGSARNVLSATVEYVEFDGDRARVRLDGRPPLVAEVTAASASELGLAAGERVWASVKATEVRIEPL